MSGELSAEQIAWGAAKCGVNVSYDVLSNADGTATCRYAPEACYQGFTVCLHENGALDTWLIHEDRDVDAIMSTTAPGGSTTSAATVAAAQSRWSVSTATEAQYRINEVFRQMMEANP